jgi:hypothetical protein
MLITQTNTKSKALFELQINCNGEDLLSKTWHAAAKADISTQKYYY